MEKLANHIALQGILAGGMEKQAYTLPDYTMAGGIGAAGAALGSEDHKTLSGILGAGTGACSLSISRPDASPGQPAST